MEADAANSEVAYDPLYECLSSTRLCRVSWSRLRASEKQAKKLPAGAAGTVNFLCNLSAGNSLPFISE